MTISYNNLLQDILSDPIELHVTCIVLKSNNVFKVGQIKGLQIKWREYTSVPVELMAMVTRVTLIAKISAAA